VINIKEIIGKSCFEKNSPRADIIVFMSFYSGIFLGFGDRDRRYGAICGEKKSNGKGGETRNIINEYGNHNDNKRTNLPPTFARHETFHSRFGWLKKGFDKAIESPDVFLSEAAPSIPESGKIMVKAIKYWCIAFKVLEDVFIAFGLTGIRE
jgi:hypothetical protein